MGFGPGAHPLTVSCRLDLPSSVVLPIDNNNIYFILFWYTVLQRQYTSLYTKKRFTITSEHLDIQDHV